MEESGRRGPGGGRDGEPVPPAPTRSPVRPTRSPVVPPGRQPTDPNRHVLVSTRPGTQPHRPADLRPARPALRPRSVVARAAAAGEAGVATAPGYRERPPATGDGHGGRDGGPATAWAPRVDEQSWEGGTHVEGTPRRGIERTSARGSGRRTTGPSRASQGTRSGRPSGALGGEDALLDRWGPELARLVGVGEEHRPPGPEANARLTGTTGLVLIVLLAAEGVTVPFIAPLFSWHIVIGLALIPPLLLKLGSTLYRFLRYYLRNPSYRRAGPPHPLLRLLGPLVMITTVVLMASGVALWIAGPHARLLLRVHQVAFVLWFVVLAVHVLSHVLRAFRLARADSADLRARAPGAGGARVRRAVVALSVVAGVILSATLVGGSVVRAWGPAIGGRAVVRPTASSSSHR